MTKSDFIEVIVSPTDHDGKRLTGQAGIQKHAFVPISSIDFIVKEPGNGYVVKIKDNAEQRHNLMIVSTVENLDKIFRH